MPISSVPEIPDSRWDELASPQILDAGKKLLGAVHDVMWVAPNLRGKVNEGARRFLTQIDFSIPDKPSAKCTCELGKHKKICKHALAIYFSYFSKNLCGKSLLSRERIERNLRENAPLSFIQSTPPKEEQREGEESYGRIAGPKDFTGISVPRSVPCVSSGKLNSPRERRNPNLPLSHGNSLRKPAFASPQKTILNVQTQPENLPMRPSIDGNTEWISITLPSRLAPNYSAIYDKVKYNFFDLDARQGKWFLRGEHKVLCFLAREWEKFKARFSPKISPNFNASLQSLRFAKIKTDIVEIAEHFDLSVSLDVGDVPIESVNTALSCSYPYVKGKQGKIVLIPREISEKFENLRERLEEGKRYGTAPIFRRRISRTEVAAADAVLDELGVNFEPPSAWRERSKALRDLSQLKPAPIPEPLGSSLRNYQQIGVAWLWHLYKHQLGGILADEMGLGKTVEAIAFLSAFFAEKQGQTARALVVAPAGLVENWRRELARFAPNLPVQVHHGNTRSRKNLNSFENGIVLTSYATLRIDNDEFLQSPWALIIADEAQQVKNRRSRNSRALREIPAPLRFILTGTPVENSIEDLKTLFDFILPGLMPKEQDKLQGMNLSERRERDNSLVKTLAAPYILRRTKNFVAPELPSKIEQIIWCRPCEKQAKLYFDYKEHSEHEFFNLEMSGASDGNLRIAAFNQLLRLRQICTEPRILNPELSDDDSAKLRALREILDEAIVNKRRVLVFSQFVSVLAFIKNALQKDGIKFEYIDGTIKNRAEVCERFNQDDSIPVCLISLKAGGVGLNLTGADMVVHYDPWWNPAIEAQANDRAHRIGQTRQVTVIKLIMADSVEERVLELQHEKRRLVESVFEASDIEALKISLTEMKELLK